MSRILIRVQLAKYFHINPFELEDVPESKLREVLAVVEALAEKGEDDDGTK